MDAFWLLCNIEFGISLCMAKRQLAIKTSDQVLIRFEVAGLRDRAFAFIIDQLILYGAIVALSIFGGIGKFNEWYWYLIVIPVFVFYSLFFEIILGGLTPGKKAIGIRVVKLNGKYPIPIDYILRWVFRWLDIWMSLTIIGSILVNSSRFGQRLGDLMAGTTVIRLQSSAKITLRDILSIDSTVQYTPKYPQVTLLQDEDLLLVKKVIQQSTRFPNEAHRKALNELTVHLKNELDIHEKTKSNVAFLNTLLKDYVVLTR